MFLHVFSRSEIFSCLTGKTQRDIVLRGGIDRFLLAAREDGIFYRTIYVCADCKKAWKPSSADLTEVGLIDIMNSTLPL